MTDRFVCYPGHLGNAPTTQLQGRIGKIAWKRVGQIALLPAVDAESLTSLGGFLAAIPVEEALGRLGLDDRSGEALALEACTVPELQEIASGRGLSTSGRKAELIERLVEREDLRSRGLRIENYIPRDGDPVEVVVIDDAYRALRRAMTRGE